MYLVLTGSHTSLASQERMGRIQDGENWRELAQRNFFSGLLRDRRLAGRLQLALEGFEGITCLWLAEAFPGLRPTDPAPKFEQLVAEVRLLLARPSPTSDPLPLKRSAEPLIYVREGQRWQPFTSDRSRGPYKTTDKLIEEFKKAHKRQPSLDGILVKVLPDDVADHNKLDPPMITALQLAKGKQAGLSAVLLDRRYGVVSLPKARKPALPVYAV